MGRKGLGERQEWAKEVERLGTEILLNAIDRDGKGQGYDLDVIEEVVQAVKIPVIAQGGVGEWHRPGGIEKPVPVPSLRRIFFSTLRGAFTTQRPCDHGLNVRSLKWKQ